jgi:hypothetical protein
MPGHTNPRGVAWLTTALLGVLGFAAVYAAIVAGELVAGAWASRAFGRTGLTITGVRLAIHTVITLPIASVVGYGLVRRAPAVGLQAVAVVIVLWSIVIVALQLIVYEPRVVGASALKVLFVVVPLLAGSSVARRTIRKEPRV